MEKSLGVDDCCCFFSYITKLCSKDGFFSDLDGLVDEVGVVDPK